MKNDQTLSQSELAQYFNVSSRTIRSWVNKGMPKISIDNYSIQDCCKWYTERLLTKIKTYQSNLEEKKIKLRLLDAKATLSELELGIKKNEYVKLKDVQNELNDITSVIRKRLLYIPRKLAPQLTNIAVPQEVEKIIEEEVYFALEELSKSPVNNIN